jgi:ubiquitin-protein ligase
MSNTFLREKRIKSDIKHFINGNYDIHGIFIDFNDSDITKLKGLIIGPDGTPYEGGFYMFDVEFPLDYPYSPPKIKFISPPDVRFNPNLYTNGKVCLSMLNTWNGPSWEPTLSLSKILITIQSILNINPLQNEPGFENVELNNETNNNTKSLNYRNIINYFNIECSVLKIVENMFYGYEGFKEVVETYFVKNINKYKKFIKDNLNYDTPIIYSSVYNMQKKINITQLNESLLKNYNNLIKKYPHLIEPNVENLVEEHIVENLVKEPIVENLDEEPIVAETKKKYIRKCPTNLAKNYPIGHIQISPYNNKNYMVKEVNYKDQKVKRWALSK